MSEYLKMADVFCGEVQADADLLFDDDISNIADFSGYKTHCRYAAHAIDNHDALVDENQRLRNLLKKCRPYIKDESDWGYDGEMNLLAEIDKATGEVK